MGRDRQETIMIAALVLCTLAQAALTVWLVVDQFA